MLDPVEEILRRHGLSGPWQPLTATGRANRVYATHDVVLRVATDHPDGLTDARTESVAAPAAHRAGIRTPRLLAFDDSRSLIDRPYTLWERVHAETLGLVKLNQVQSERVWWETGRELARIHSRVTECPDPSNYLDPQDRALNLEEMVASLEATGKLTRSLADEVRQMVRLLRGYMEPQRRDTFVHADVHAMNIMCSREGELAAIIDWGDAGWGDPAYEFGRIPFAMVPAALAGYRSEVRDPLGNFPEARMVWDQLDHALNDLLKNRAGSLSLKEYWSFLESGKVPDAEAWENRNFNKQ